MRRAEIGLALTRRFNVIYRYLNFVIICCFVVESVLDVWYFIFAKYLSPIKFLN